MGMGGKMTIKFIKKASLYVVIIITLISLGLMINLNISDAEKIHVTSSQKMYVLIYFLLALCAGYALYKVKDQKYFILGLFGVAFIIRLIWVLNINSQPVSDFTQMYKGAQNILNGNTDLVRNSEYFRVWVYQLGFAFFQSNILRIFGDSIEVLKVTNAFISACIPVVIFLICNNLKRSKGSRIPALIYCFYVTSIAMTSVLTNQHLATLLIYIGLYIFMKYDKSYIGLIFFGIIISLGNVIRPEGIIVMIGIILFLIFKDFDNIRNIKVFAINNITKPMLILIVYMMTTTLVSATFKGMGLTDYNLGNREPYWKFVVGLNVGHNGLWNPDDGDLVNKYSLGEERDEFEKKLIFKRLGNKEEIVKLFKRKFEYMWSGSDWGSISFALNYEEAPKDLRQILLRTEKLQFIGIVILAFVSIIISIRKRIYLDNYHLFMILFIGYVLSHLIVEVQTRYRYFIIPCMIILTAEVFTTVLNLAESNER